MFEEITELKFEGKIYRRYLGEFLFVNDSGQVISWNGIRPKKVLKASNNSKWLLKNRKLLYSSFSL